MKLKLNIHTLVTNKTLSIPLILVFSVCLFVTHAFAGGCNGGESCFNCSLMDHRHPTDPQTGFMPHGCQPGTPDSTCGISTDPLFNHQNFLVSVIRVDNLDNSSIPVGLAPDFSKNLFSTSSLSIVHFSALATSPPIYLLNLSLLC